MQSNVGMGNTGGRRLAFCASLRPPVRTLAWLGNLVILHTYLPMKMEQSVPKLRHTKFRCRRITQKKACNISSVTFALWNSAVRHQKAGNLTGLNVGVSQNIARW